MSIPAGIPPESLSRHTHHDAWGTKLLLVALCYPIPSAIQEAGSRISFGIWVIPAERQTAGAPWAHGGATSRHCGKSLSETSAVIRRAPLLWLHSCELQAGLATQSHAICSTVALRNVSSLLPVSTGAELSSKILSHSKPGADASQRWDSVHKNGNKNSSLQAKLD